MRIAKKAKTGLGRTIQVIGFILWIGAAIVTFIWTLFVLFSVFGVWTIFVGIILAPVTYIASIFIVWFTTGNFPIILLVPYLASFVGIALIAGGASVSGDK